MTNHNPAHNTRMLTLAGGGWVLLLTGLVCLGLVVWAVAPAMMRHFNRPPGDGKNIESYGFDLSNLLVDRRLIVPAMLHRDMVPVMTEPTSSSAAEAQKTNDLKYAKYLVASDLVIGVEVNGEARAYPINVMYVHEIINDTLAGVPIAVTYHWPCDSVTVFDRRVGDETLQFHISGLVYNANMLMYERVEDNSQMSPMTQMDDETSAPPATSAEKESLWSQLLAKAVSGPKARTALTSIAYELQRWDDWLARHPNTTVLNRDLRIAARYKDAAPTEYLQNDELLFAVAPAPPASGPAAKTRVIAVEAAGRRRVYSLDYLADRARQTPGESIYPSWIDTLGDATLHFVLDRSMQTVRVEYEPADTTVRVTHVYWFAWHALHPEDELVTAP